VHLDDAVHVLQLPLHVPAHHQPGHHWQELVARDVRNWQFLKIG
jgi:hypothetical protein